MSKIVKIYDSVIELIKSEIAYSFIEGEASEEFMKENQIYIAGLKLAVRLLEKEQDFVYSEHAYEKFEEVLLSYLDEKTNQSINLELEDIKDIISEHMGNIS